jgi:hypothetical protein
MILDSMGLSLPLIEHRGTATTPARGPPAWHDDLTPMPDWDLIAQPHPGFAFDQRIS